MKSLKLLSKKSFTTTLKNFIGGKFIESKSTTFYETINPVTQELISKVPESTQDEFELAVTNSKQAFQAWRNIPILSRQRYGRFAIFNKKKTK